MFKVVCKELQHFSIGPLLSSFHRVLFGRPLKPSDPLSDIEGTIN